MSDQPQPQVNHVEKVAEQVIADAVTYVRNHPTYAHLVEQLGVQALQVVASSAGIPI